MYIRKCPTCYSELNYKTKIIYTRALQKNSKCISCTRKSHPKKGEYKKCSGCGIICYKPKSEIQKRNFCSLKCLNSIHGELSPAWKGGRQESKKREYIRLKNLRKELKQKGVDFLGGKCQNCGYNKCIAALDFHHPTQNEKTDKFFKKCESTWEFMKEQIKNCILLCATCHREHHYINGGQYKTSKYE